MSEFSVTLLGSTGSIGTQALDVVRRLPERFRIEALAAGRNLARLADQVREFQPRLVSIHHNRRASRRDHVGFYLIESFRQTTPKQPDHEIAEAGFFPLTALPAGVTPATLRRIREVFEEAAASPHW